VVVLVAVVAVGMMAPGRGNSSSVLTLGFQAAWTWLDICLDIQLETFNKRLDFPVGCPSLVALLVWLYASSYIIIPF
jgi:hypothetical protein